MSNVGINPFAGTGDAKIFERGQYVKAGFIGAVQIDKCIYKQTEKGKTAFICEFTVLETNNTEDPAGSKRSWYQDMQQLAAKPALKEWLYAVCGFNTKNDADKAEAKAVVDPIADQAMLGACQQGILNGKKLGLSTYNKVTVTNKKDFTVHDWSPKEPKLNAPKAA